MNGNEHHKQIIKFKQYFSILDSRLLAELKQIYSWLSSFLALNGHHKDFDHIRNTCVTALGLSIWGSDHLTLQITIDCKLLCTTLRIHVVLALACTPYSTVLPARIVTRDATFNDHFQRENIRLYISLILVTHKTPVVSNVHWLNVCRKQKGYRLASYFHLCVMSANKGQIFVDLDIL